MAVSLCRFLFRAIPTVHSARCTGPREFSTMPPKKRPAKESAVENGSGADGGPRARLTRAAKQTPSGGSAAGADEPPKKVRGRAKRSPEPESEEGGEAKGKPAKAKRAPKAAPKKDEDAKGKEQEASKPKRGKKKPDGEASGEESQSKKPKPLQNKATTDFATVDFACDKQNDKGKAPNLRISSWNVDGLRAWVKKGGLDYVAGEDPDVLCLQETKCGEEQLPAEAKKFEGYSTYWCSGEKKGYAGVALYSKTEPISVRYGLGVDEFDDEGRCITAEYDGFYLVNVYVPNAGRGLVTLPKRLSWNESFKKHVKDLDAIKPVIVCGDMNVAHKEIDLTNPATNKKNAGFTPEERQGMTEFLEEGFVDSYRELYPDKKDAYTFWSYMNNARAKNVGWRLDYFIVSKRFMENICDNAVRSEVFGSDHCPITLFLNV